jgi:hypothetical protein
LHRFANRAVIACCDGNGGGRSSRGRIEYTLGFGAAKLLIIVAVVGGCDAVVDQLKFSFADAVITQCEYKFGNSGRPVLPGIMLSVLKKK